MNRLGGARAQNGAVSRHTVLNLKFYSCSINQAHAHYCEIVGKALGNQRKKNVFTRGSSAPLSA